MMPSVGNKSTNIDSNRLLNILTEEFLSTNDNLKLELLMSQDLFEEEDLKELEDILNNLQKLVIKISQRGENNGTK